MSEAKHTPGPWTISPPQRERDGHRAIYFSEQREIYPPDAERPADQHGGPLAVVSLSTECGEANAALLMAAPDLLAAAVRYLRWTLRPGVCPEFDECYADARAALQSAVSKATGTPS